MADDVKQLDGEHLLRNSSLYREFQAEREEILKHKWIESEKAGYDIGFERALTDWILKHRSKWRAYRQSLARAAQGQGAGAESPAGAPGSQGSPGPGASESEAQPSP
ncbi:hypothetical protein [Limisphaera sp. VF-2]|jgi:hypothetical protein|uniref:hypothetical protein n=1 Tax=Limisphaera sp. VF-2 TaxID=3400418 RepID=UPI0025668F51|nr:DUF4032 domain-containing protein [Limisphaera sp.]